MTYQSETKVCAKCQKSKALDLFVMRKTAVGGYGSHCIECSRLMSRETASRRKASPERQAAHLAGRADASVRIRAMNRARLYGISPEVQQDLMDSQDSCCAGCGVVGDESVFHVDHDHKTGAVRGFLCKKCNSILGLAADDPGRLYDLAEYLVTHHRLQMRQA